ncbi:hypothetical protein R3P38DRAFT_3244799 [Favolaschia claudopus]|uniref:Uncharacterized protein n=1 Tax=Favolaschia claudopus TaxID=2862362 RepID=A0AAV9Z1B9_9AGAR
MVRNYNPDTPLAEFREKKRKLRDEGRDAAEGGQQGQPKKKRRKSEGGAEPMQKIRPGETLAHFNKPTCDRSYEPPSNPPWLPSAPSTRNLKTLCPLPLLELRPIPPPSKGKPKPKHTDDNDDPHPPHDKHATRPKEFQHTSTAAPRRLNDIAQAPPDLSALARKAKLKSKDPNMGDKTKTKSSSSILSPAQQLQMAAAREAAVARYREMKAARRAARGAAGGERGGGPVDEGDE